MPSQTAEDLQFQQPLRDTTRFVLTKAKEASPVVKFGLEKLSELWASQPAAAQVQNYADPLLNTVDAQLVKAYAALPAYRQTAELQLAKAKTQWFTRVDAILTAAKSLDVQQVTTTTAEVKQSIQAFYATSVDHFLVLAKAKLTIQVSNGEHTDGTLTREEFVNGLRNKLKHVWDDSLVGPAELFYERAKTLYIDHIGTKVHALTAPADDSTETPAYKKFLTHLRQQLDSQWEQTVVAGLYPKLQDVSQQLYPKLQETTTRVSQPAKELYASALNHYLQLRENQRIVKATEFIQSYKQVIGSTWNDRLEQPLRELITAWKTSGTGELEKLYKAVDAHNKGYLTLSDFVATGTNAIGVAQSTLGQQWQALLTYSVSTFDSIVPSTETDEMKLKAEADPAIPVTVTGVATHVTKRLRDHSTNAYTAVRKRAAHNVEYVKSSAQSRLDGARQYGIDHLDYMRKFSSERLAPYIHIDLIKNAENLLQTRGKPAYHSVQAHVEAAHTQVVHSVHSVQSHVETAHTQVRQSLDQLQATLVDITNKAKSHIPVDAVQHQWSHVKSTAQSVTTPVITTATNKLPINELKRKLRDTILNAKALTHTSSEYALHRQLSLIPSDLLILLLQTKRIFLTPSSHHSPSSSSNSSPSTSPSTSPSPSPSATPSPLDDAHDIELVILKIQDVVSSIKELFHWSNVEQENHEQQEKSKMDIDSQ